MQDAEAIRDDPTGARIDWNVAPVRRGEAELHLRSIVKKHADGGELAPVLRGDVARFSKLHDPLMAFEIELR